MCFASRQVTEGLVNLASLAWGEVMQGHRGASADSGGISPEMAPPYQRRKGLGTWVLSACLPLLPLPQKQHTGFKANFSTPRLLEAITRVGRLRDHSGI